MSYTKGGTFLPGYEIIEYPSEFLHIFNIILSYPSHNFVERNQNGELDQNAQFK